MDEFEEESQKATLFKDQKLPFKVLAIRSWPYIKQEIWSFIVSLLFLGLQVVLSVILPLFEEMLINTLYGVGIERTVSNVIWLGLSYPILALIINISVYLSGMVLAKAGQRIVYKLRMEVFTHVESMSQNQFNQMPVGSLVTRVATYTTSLSNMFTHTFVSFIVNSLTIVGVFIVMIIKSWILALILLGFIGLIGLSTVIFAKYISKVFRDERKRVSDLNGYLNESLSGMKIIQLFNREDTKLNDFNKKNELLRKARYNVVLGYGLYRPLASFFQFCAIGAIFIAGVRLNLNGGEILAFYLFLNTFFNPVMQIADQLNEVQRGLSGLERLFNLLDIEPEVLDVEHPLELEEIKGEIEFKNVWFAYVDEQWILRDVSFKIKAGDSCAFVGATGAGKTTILGLIVRNFEPQKGEILIDGINIKNIKLDSLRKLTGQMLQDVFLFSGNVRNNITLFDDSISDNKVMEACEYVNADKFINNLPNKLDEPVNGHGENFSQGQRQLLSFARTIIHKPSILILDEATANIDTETEALIQDSLEKMRNIGTMLVVAHRLSTIQKSDQIIVLHKGEIIERGTHQELLKLRGQYYKLYQLQFEE